MKTGISGIISSSPDRLILRDSLGAGELVNISLEHGGFLELLIFSEYPFM